MQQKIFRSVAGVFMVLAVMAFFSACGTKTTAPEKAESIASADEPVAGLYVNKAHQFTVNYPVDWEIGTPSDVEVFKTYKPSTYKLPVLTASVADLKEGATLDTAAPDYFEAVKENIPASKRFKVLSEEMITLNDGTPAKAIAFKWSYDAITKLQSGVLVVHKDGTAYILNATTLFGGDTTPDMLIELVKQFNFL